MPKGKEVKKRQHYVPQFYLKRFSVDGQSVFVFDKFQQKVFRTNVYNIANEKYFYDFPVGDVNGRGEDVQLVENALAQIEGDYSVAIDNILQRVHRKPGGKVLESSRREGMSYFIALQATRTREYRVVQTQLVEKGAEAISRKAGRSQQDQYRIQANADYVSLQQSLSMFGPVVQAIAHTLYEHIWLIGINRTEQPLYTSDAPVARRAHKKDPYGIISYAGFGSEGIEIALPITPQYILILCEAKFHRHMADKNDRAIILDNPEFIKYYNSLQVAQSYRQIYCPSDSFDLAKEMCESHPGLCNPNRDRIVVE